MDLDTATKTTFASLKPICTQIMHVYAVRGRKYEQGKQVCVLASEQKHVLKVLNELITKISCSTSKGMVRCIDYILIPLHLLLPASPKMATAQLTTAHEREMCFWTIFATACHVGTNVFVSDIPRMNGCMERIAMVLSVWTQKNKVGNIPPSADTIALTSAAISCLVAFLSGILQKHACFVLNERMVGDPSTALETLAMQSISKWCDSLDSSDISLKNKHLLPEYNNKLLLCRHSFIGYLLSGLLGVATASQQQTILPKSRHHAIFCVYALLHMNRAYSKSFSETKNIHTHVLPGVSTALRAVIAPTRPKLVHGGVSGRRPARDPLGARITLVSLLALYEELYGCFVEDGFSNHKSSVYNTDTLRDLKSLLQNGTILTSKSPKQSMPEEAFVRLRTLLTDIFKECHELSSVRTIHQAIQLAVLVMKLFCQDSIQRNDTVKSDAARAMLRASLLYLATTLAHPIDQVRLYSHRQLSDTLFELGNVKHRLAKMIQFMFFQEIAKLPRLANAAAGYTSSIENNTELVQDMLRDTTSISHADLSMDVIDSSHEQTQHESSDMDTNTGLQDGEQNLLVTLRCATGMLRLLKLLYTNNGINRSTTFNADAYQPPYLNSMHNPLESMFSTQQSIMKIVMALSSCAILREDVGSQTHSTSEKLDIMIGKDIRAPNSSQNGTFGEVAACPLSTPRRNALAQSTTLRCPTCATSVQSASNNTANDSNSTVCFECQVRQVELPRFRMASLDQSDLFDAWSCLVREIGWTAIHSTLDIVTTCLEQVKHSFRNAWHSLNTSLGTKTLEVDQLHDNSPEGYCSNSLKTEKKVSENTKFESINNVGKLRKFVAHWRRVPAGLLCIQEFMLGAAGVGLNSSNEETKPQTSSRTTLMTRCHIVRRLVESVILGITTSIFETRLPRAKEASSSISQPFGLNSIQTVSLLDAPLWYSVYQNDGYQTIQSYPYVISTRSACSRMLSLRLLAMGSICIGPDIQTYFHTILYPTLSQLTAAAPLRGFQGTGSITGLSEIQLLPGDFVDALSSAAKHTLTIFGVTASIDACTMWNGETFDDVGATDRNKDTRSTIPSWYSIKYIYQPPISPVLVVQPVYSQSGTLVPMQDHRDQTKQPCAMSNSNSIDGNSIADNTGLNGQTTNIGKEKYDTKNNARTVDGSMNGNLTNVDQPTEFANVHVNGIRSEDNSGTYTSLMSAEYIVERRAELVSYLFAANLDLISTPLTASLRNLQWNPAAPGLLHALTYATQSLHLSPLVRNSFSSMYHLAARDLCASIDSYRFDMTLLPSLFRCCAALADAYAAIHTIEVNHIKPTSSFIDKVNLRSTNSQNCASSIHVEETKISSNTEGQSTRSSNEKEFDLQQVRAQSAHKMLEHLAQNGRSRLISMIISQIRGSDFIVKKSLDAFLVQNSPSALSSLAQYWLVELAMRIATLLSCEDTQVVVAGLFAFRRIAIALRGTPGTLYPLLYDTFSYTLSKFKATHWTSSEANSLMLIRDQMEQWGQYSYSNNLNQDNLYWRAVQQGAIEWFLHVTILARGSDFLIEKWADTIWPIWRSLLLVPQTITKNSSRQKLKQSHQEACPWLTTSAKVSNFSNIKLNISDLHIVHEANNGSRPTGTLTDTSYPVPFERIQCCILDALQILCLPVFVPLDRAFKGKDLKKKPSSDWQLGPSLLTPMLDELLMCLLPFLMSNAPISLQYRAENVLSMLLLSADDEQRQFCCIFLSKISSTKHSKTTIKDIDAWHLAQQLHHGEEIHGSSSSSKPTSNKDPQMEHGNWGWGALQGTRISTRKYGMESKPNKSLQQSNSSLTSSNLLELQKTIMEEDETDTQLDPLVPEPNIIGLIPKSTKRYNSSLVQPIYHQKDENLWLDMVNQVPIMSISVTVQRILSKMKEQYDNNE